MHAKKPSQTALMVAMFRALSTEGFTTAKVHDPVAEKLLPRGWLLTHALIRRSLAKAKPEVRRRVGQQLDTAVVRVLAIDEELESAVAAGCRQLVILGAGLDARAHRLESLRDVRVFEVDHPQTQEWKRRKAADLKPIAKSLTWVPVNFERDDLSEKLRESGHRADEPTVWIWEGVVMYLTDAALRATLRAIAGSSAPGSVALVHYHEPIDRPDAEFRAMRVLLRLWREPQIGIRTRAQMAEEAGAVGLRVVRDTGHPEWAARFGAASPSAMSRRSRLLVVTR